MLVVVVVAIGIGIGVHKATEGDKKPTRTQRTVLLSLIGSDHSAIESALIASHGPQPGAQALELLVPSTVLTDVCGYGTQQFGHIVALPDGTRLASVAMSSLLGGVTIDGSWLLSTDQLRRLVDAVGGVTVKVDADVVQQTAGGGRVLLVQKGDHQHLDGSRAVAFATYVAPGEDTSGDLARFQAVLDAVLTALPQQKSRVVGVLNQLGPGATSTLGAQRLADVLAGMAQDIRSNNLLPSNLPVAKIDSGGTPTYRIDPAPTTKLVASNLGNSWPASARRSHARVFVQNGVGTPGLVQVACTRLVAAGFSFAGSGNAASFGYKTSKVLVFDTSVASARMGARVAAALQVPRADVEVSTQGQNVADVLVIIGKDFKH